MTILLEKRQVGAGIHVPMKQGVAKWREIRAYLDSINEAFPHLEQPVGRLVIAALTAQDGKHAGPQKSAVELANLNATKPAARREDVSLQEIMGNLPGLQHISMTESEVTTRYTVAFTCTMGRQALMFFRSQVPDMVPERDPRIIYAVTSSLLQPLQP